MHDRSAFICALAIVWSVCVHPACAAAAESEAAARKDAHDIFKQLIEINTTDSVGSVNVASRAMAQRLMDAGFPKADVVVLGPNDRKGNMVARLRGNPVTREYFAQLAKIESGQTAADMRAILAVPPDP
ncbi:MAG: hypothetical protein M3O26_17190 [Pseudomonadota bacterium]|nr:hypothetical protein [Pseudomonadota bacterium]